MKINHKDTTIMTICPFCGRETDVAVNVEDVIDWCGGELIQNAFPYLSADEREMLVSGICPTCWDMTFGEED